MNVYEDIPITNFIDNAVLMVSAASTRASDGRKEQTG
jgi:hypothetical protein